MTECRVSVCNEQAVGKLRGAPYCWQHGYALWLQTNKIRYDAQHRRMLEQKPVVSNKDAKEVAEKVAGHASPPAYKLVYMKPFDPMQGGLPSLGKNQ